MANALGLDPSILREGILRGLLSAGAPHASFPDAELDIALSDAVRSVQQDLSTRFKVTTFRGHLGPEPLPPLDPDGTEEVEGPYTWPSPLPGEGLLHLQTRVRPVVEVLGASLQLPGVVAGSVELPPSWFRVDGMAGELILTPTLGTAPLMAAGLPMTFPTLFPGRLPMSLLLTYRAGLGVSGLARWPRLRRLVLFRAAIQVLPALALELNPGLLTSMSADGLSQSRTSSYVFKDLEARLSEEAEALRTSFLDLWDGPALGVM
jgi:hypothetical protein